MTDLDATTMLDIRLSATISRGQYTRTPDEIITDLRQIAGHRTDVFAHVAGTWAGFHENTPHLADLVAALRDLPGADEWVPLGRARGTKRYRGVY